MARSIKRVSRDIDQTDTEIALYVEKLSRFLNRTIEQTLRDLERGETSALEAAKLLGGLSDALDEAGLKERIAKVRDLYDSQVIQIEFAFAEFLGEHAILSAVDLDVIATLERFDASVVENRIAAFVDSLKSTVMRSVILGQTPDIPALAEPLDLKLKADLRAELNTAMAGFNRSVNFRKAESYGVDTFVYLGPLDKVTRPFCVAHVNKVYRKAEIEEMDNGQGLDVMLYGGGYNCRHRWQAISEEKAKELGFA